MLKARWSGGQRREESGTDTFKPGFFHQPRRTRCALWYAIHLPEYTENLYDLARRCQHISDYVSVARGGGDGGRKEGADALLIEVRSSLRYFGGIKSLVRELTSSLHDVHYCGALSPSPSASLLMARCGIRRAVQNPDELRSALGDIGIDQLPFPDKLHKALQRCGLVRLREIWRIPAGEIRLRFGRPLYDYLNYLLAARQEIPPRWQDEKSFSKQLSFDNGLASNTQLLHYADKLLQDFVDFLISHHLQSDQVHIELLCETPPPVSIPLTTRYPGHDKQLLMTLLELTLHNQKLPSAVQQMSLYSHSFSLFNPMSRQGSLADMLAARLGQNHILQLSTTEEYAPEFASCTENFQIKISKKTRIENLPSSHRSRLPCLLVQPPKRLPVNNSILYYMTPLSILRGPQRIETRWWAGQSIRRDYYVARNQQGSQLWVFQDLNNTHHWYLHGIFS